jgi:hypothetical protein
MVICPAFTGKQITRDKQHGIRGIRRPINREKDRRSSPCCATAGVDRSSKWVCFCDFQCPCFEKAGRSSIIWLRFVNWSGEVGCQFPSHCLPRSGFVSAFRIDALSRGGGEAGSRKLGEDRLRHLCCNLGEGRQRCAAGGGVPSMLPKWFVFAISPNAVRIMFPYFLDYLASFGNFLQIARSVSPGRFLCRADD